MLAEARQRLQQPSAVRDYSSLLDGIAAQQVAQREADVNRNESGWGDVGTALKSGLLQLPGAAAGLADTAAGLAGFNRPVSRTADALGELTGFQPGQWAEDIGRSEYTRETLQAQQAAEQGFDEGGWSGGLQAYLKNPRAIGTLIGESAPAMVAGGAAGLGLRSLGVISNPVLAGAVGEGLVGAGFAMDQIDEAVDPQKAALASLATGVSTAGFAALGGAIARRLGLGDPETILAGGRAVLAPGAKNKGLITRVVGGAISEGVLQELPQGSAEQMIQNWAEGNPIYDNVDRAAVQSVLSGAAMGAGFNLVGARYPQAVDLTNRPEGADGDAPRKRFNITEADESALLKAYGSFQRVAENTPKHPDLAQTALRQMQAIQNELKRRGMPASVVNENVAETSYINMYNDVRKLTQSYNDAVAGEPGKAQRLLKKLEAKKAAMQSLVSQYPRLAFAGVQSEYNELVGVGRKLADELARARSKKDGKAQTQLRSALAANKERLRELRDNWQGDQPLSYTGAEIASKRPKPKATRAQKAAPAAAPAAPAAAPAVEAADAFVDDDAELVGAPTSPGLASLQRMWSDNELEPALATRIFRKDGQLQGGSDPKRPKGYWAKLQQMTPEQLVAERERVQGSDAQSALWQSYLVEAFANNDAREALQQLEQARAERLSRPIDMDGVVEAFSRLQLTDIQRQRFEDAAFNQELRGQGITDAANEAGRDRKSVLESVNKVWDKLVREVQTTWELPSAEAAEAALEEVMGPSPRKQVAAKRAADKKARVEAALAAAQVQPDAPAAAPVEGPAAPQVRTEVVDGQEVQVTEVAPQLSPAERRAADIAAGKAPAAAPAKRARTTGRVVESDAEDRLSAAENAFIAARDSGDPAEMAAAEQELQAALDYAEGLGAVAESDAESAAQAEFSGLVAAGELSVMSQSVAERSRDLQREGPDTLRGFLNAIPLSPERAAVQAQLDAIKKGTVTVSKEQHAALKDALRLLKEDDAEQVKEIISLASDVDKLSNVLSQARHVAAQTEARIAQLPRMQKTPRIPFMQGMWGAMQNLVKQHPDDPAYALAYPDVTWDRVFNDATMLDAWGTELSEALFAAGIANDDIASANPKQRGQLVRALVLAANRTTDKVAVEAEDGTRQVSSAFEHLARTQAHIRELEEVVAAAKSEFAEAVAPVRDALGRLAAEIESDPAAAKVLDKTFNVGEMLLNAKRSARKGSKMLLDEGFEVEASTVDEALDATGVEGMLDAEDAPIIADGLTQPANDFYADETGVEVADPRAGDGVTDFATSSWQDVIGYNPNPADQAMEKELSALKDGIALAEWAVANAPNKAMRYFAQKVLDRIKALNARGVTFDFEVLTGMQRASSMAGARGMAKIDPTAKPGTPFAVRILLNGAAQLQAQSNYPPGMSYDVVLHELVHAATSAQLIWAPNTPGAQQLMALFNEIVRRYNDKVLNNKPLSDFEEAFFKGRTNTLKNPRELLAWGLTDGDMQQYLAGIKLGPKTAWQRFKEVIAKILGVSREYHSAFDELLLATEKIFETSAGEVTANVVLANVTPVSDAAQTQGPPPLQTTDTAFDRVLQRLPPDASYSWNTLRKKTRQLGGLFAFTSDFVAWASEAMPDAKVWFETVQRRVTERNRLDVELQGVVDPVQRMSSAQVRGLNKYLKEATLSGRWGFDAYAAGIEPEAIVVEPADAAKFRRLDREQQRVAIAMFKQAKRMKDALNRQMAEDVRDLYDGMIERSSNEERISALEQERDAKVDLFLSRVGQSMPSYLPLKRFGPYATVWRSGEFTAAQQAGDDRAVEEMKRIPQHYQVFFSETFNQAQRRADEIRGSDVFSADGTLDTFERARIYGNTEFLPYNMLEAIKARFEADEFDTGAADGETRRVNVSAMANALNRYYIEALNEDSARKSELKRLNVAGADDDMVRAFITHATSMNATISALRTNRETQVVLQNMRNLARDSTASTALRDRRNEVLNEIESRHRLLIDPKPEVVTDRVMGATSIYMLLSSPAYYIQNATQPFMLTLPWLSAKYGVAASTAALLRGYKTINKAWIPALDGALSNINERTVPDPNVRKLFRRLEELGLFDIGIAADLGAFRQDRSGVMGVVGAAHRKMVHGVRTVELFNRGASAAAAFQLELSKNGGNVDAAINAAVEAVQVTQGDYGVANAPRIIDKLPAGRLVTQFRKFQLIQISILARALHSAFASADPVERGIGRRQLAYIMATHGAMGGLMGLPAANLVGFLLAHVFGDEDEPDDFELMARRAIGDPGAADLILKGLPTLAGMDVSSRVGMGYAFALLPFTDIELTREGWSSIIVGALGPSAAQGQAIWDGAGMVTEGNTLLGVAQMLPRGLRDALRAVAYGTDGVTRRNAERDVVLSSDDLDWFDLSLQGLGWPTQTLTDAASKRRWLRSSEEHFTGRAGELRRRYIEGDAAERAEVRREWRELQRVRMEYGFKRQPISQLTKAPAAKARREAQAIDGVATRPGNRGFVEALAE